MLLSIRTVNLTPDLVVVDPFYPPLEFSSVEVCDGRSFFVMPKLRDGSASAVLAKVKE
jgi:hypothetical protein